MNPVALAIHTYHLPNALPAVSPNARRRETPRNAQSQRGTACYEPSRVTAQGQGGGRLKEEMPHRPQGKEERVVVVEKGEKDEGLEGLRGGEGEGKGHKWWLR